MFKNIKISKTAIFVSLALGLIAVTIFALLNITNPLSSNKINVLVSILPQLEIVERVGGNLVEAKTIIKPGESPATYSLTVEDLAEISVSDIYFRIGYIPFEASNIEEISDTNQDLKIIRITEDVALRYFNEEEDERSVDPHLWLSIPNMILHAGSIADELSELDPTNSLTYQTNSRLYIQELESLHNKLKRQLADIGGKHLLVFHPAWGYFAEEYGLNQVAIEQDGNDPTAEQLAEIIDFARAEDIQVIFVQKQFSTASAESIANELGIPVVQIDPLAQNYLSSLQEIADQFENYVK